MTRRRPPGLTTILATSALVTAVLSRLTLREGYSMASSDYPPLRTPEKLRPEDAEHVTLVQDEFYRVLKKAQMHWRRHLTIAIATGCCALGVPGLAIMGAPRWSMGLLGILAAVGQLLLALFRDEKIALILRRRAAETRAALRTLGYGGSSDGGSPGIRKRYEKFCDTMAAIRARYDEQTWEVGGQDLPPLPVSPAPR